VNSARLKRSKNTSLLTSDYTTLVGNQCNKTHCEILWNRKGILLHKISKQTSLSNLFFLTDFTCSVSYKHYETYVKVVWTGSLVDNTKENKHQLVNPHHISWILLD